MISTIVLAAGLSERFGSPKALAPIGKATAIAQIQQRLIESLCDEIIIVLGAHEALIRTHVLNHKGIRVVYNKDYKLGQCSSIKAGLKTLSLHAKGFTIWPVDCPWITSNSFNSLAHYFKNNKPKILIPTYKQRRGHPPLFSNSLKEEILNLPLDQGLNSLFKKHPIQTLDINDPGIIKSFNTPDELQTINN